MNLTGRFPPWANVEQSYDGFTHDPKGRRVKMALTFPTTSTEILCRNGDFLAADQFKASRHIPRCWP